MVVSFLCIMIFRRSRGTNELDFDNDHEDNGKNLNKYWKFQKVEYVKKLYKNFILFVLTVI